MKIGVYGGTFNPPHLGHIKAAEAAAKALGLDLLLMIPDGQPPHKELPQGTPSPWQRLEMLKVAVDGAGLGKLVQVSDIELQREGRSYTVDTLRTLREQYPGEELWLLLGTDMFLSIEEWYQYEEILHMAALAPFQRENGERSPAFSAQKAHLEETYGARIQLIDLEEPVEVSSTQLRQALERGEEPKELPIGVYGYILRNGLYGVKADLKHLTDQQLRAASYSMVKAKRIPHIRGTEEEAVKLARRWGVDEDLARKAAILHDCTKYLNLDEQLKLCENYGILLDGLERQALKLLHSKTGAAIAREVYGMPQEIFEAIYWHTTGKADMTRLQKVIYIADYMEPTRDFDGVEQLRQLVYQDLDRAVLLGLEMSIEEMESMGNPVHYRTTEARDWLKERLK
jgi:nicotinate-nucleotide adenylyltransferase